MVQAKRLKIFSRVVILLSASVVVAGSLYVTKDVVGNIGAYRLEINKFISNVFEARVEIPKINGKWHKFSPQISATEILIYAENDNKPAVTIDRASIEVSLIKSIFSWRLVSRELNIDHISISMNESALGSWTIAGKHFGVKNTGFLDSILSSRHLEIKSINLKLKFLSGVESAINVKNVRLENKGDFHRLLSTVNLTEAEHAVDVIIEANGNGNNIDDFDILAYLKFNHINFNSTLNSLVQRIFPSIAEHVVGFKANVNAEMWVSAAKNEKITLLGNFNSKHIYHSALRDTGPVEGLSANIVGLHSPSDGWSLNLSDLSLNFDGLQIKPLQAGLSQKSSGKVKTSTLSLDHIDLKLLGSILEKLPYAPEPFFNFFQQLKPIGNIRNFHLTLSEENDNPDIYLKANLDDVSIESWAGRPGFRQVNGYMEMHNKKGFLELDSPNGFSLHLPGIFDDFVYRSSIKGRIAWHQDLESGFTKIFSGPLQMQGVEGQANAYFYLDIPAMSVGLDSQLYLSMGVRNIDSRYKDSYLPDNLNLNLSKWIDQAMIDVKFSEAGFVWQGPIGNKNVTKVEKNRAGSTQIYMRAIDGELKFHQDWPSVTKLNAIVAVDSSMVDAKIISASIEEAKINNIALSIKKESNKAPYLSVIGDIKSDLGGAVGVLQNSPLRSRVAGLSNWNLSGESDISLDLKIPLTESKTDSRYHVDMAINQGLMSLPDTEILLEQLEGVLSYRDQKGLFSPSITGYIFHEPFSASLHTLKDNLSIEMLGNLTMNSLTQLVSLPPDDILGGKTDFIAKIIVPLEDASLPIQLKISANTKGIKVNLPSPFGKKVGTREDVEAQIAFSDPVDLKIQIGEDIKSRLELKNGSIVRGILAIKSDRLELPAEGQFLTIGHLKSFPLTQWQEASKKIFNMEEKSKSKLTPLFDILIDEVDVVGLSLKKAVFIGGYQAGDWMVGIKSDRLEGHLWMPKDSSSPMLVDLERLFLPAPSEGGAEKKEIIPSDLPYLQLTVRNFNVGDKRFGEASLLMKPQEKGVKITGIDANLLGLNIGDKDSEADLEWTVDGNVHHTSFSGLLHVSDVGEIMKAWGFSEIIDSKKARFSSQLSWPGRPWEISPDVLKGSVSMRLEDGHFYQKSSGAANALIRLVSLFNFDNWVRQLQLDFSYLYEKGMSYNKMEGGLIFEEGELTFDPPVNVNLPSGNIKLEGSASLISEEIDAQLVTTLPVSKNLPWVAAAVGGLPVAAGVFITGKVFEKQVKKLSSISYSIKGLWSAPKVEMENIFNIDTSSEKKSQKKINKANLTAEVEDNE